jgi:hypothetical protein
VPLPAAPEPTDRTLQTVRPAPVGRLRTGPHTAGPHPIRPPSTGPHRIQLVTAARRAAGLLAAGLLAAGLLAAGLLAGCGAPPEPLPTAPPRVSDSAAPSGSAYPGGIVASGLPTGPPGQPPLTVPGLPPGGYTPPAGYPPPELTTPPTTPAAPPAPRCTGGPTAAQLLAAVRDQPGLPAAAALRVGEGPFCAGGWQYFTVELPADPDSDPLLVVTRGRPTALSVVEAGADVCSDRVQHQAPAGIRTRACGVG